MQCPPRPGPGLERGEPERLRRGRVDDLPDVDPHPVAELRELVDERDVDRAVDVLEQLRQLGRLGRRDAVDGVDRGAVERRGRLRSTRRRCRRRPSGPSSSSSRCGRGRRARARKRGGSPTPAASPDSASRIGQELVARRARVRRRLEHDEVPGAQAPADLGAASSDDREVGLALLRERRRERDEDRVDARAGRRSRSSRRAAARRRAGEASPTGRPRCSSRRGAAARPDARRRRRGRPCVPASANTCASGRPT